MTKRTRIIARQADNIVEAQHVAQGMENAGASVFSVASDGYRRNVGQQRAHTCFVVWAKYDAPLTPTEIDKAIERAMPALKREGMAQ